MEPQTFKTISSPSTNVQRASSLSGSDYQPSGTCQMSERPPSSQTGYQASSNGVCVQYMHENLLIQLQDVSSEMADILADLHGQQTGEADAALKIKINTWWPGLLAWLALEAITGLIMVGSMIYVMDLPHAQFRRWREMRIDQIVVARQIREAREAGQRGR